MVLRGIMPVEPEMARQFTWHSFRVTLACLLDDLRVPHETIKRMLRWISDESLRTYIRPADDMFAGIMDRLRFATINNRQARNIQAMGNMGMIQNLIGG